MRCPTHRRSAGITSLLLRRGDLVVEIGSNDGTLLSAFRAIGATIQGVDPAAEISAQANAAGIPTLNDFFSSKLAEEIKSEKGPAKIVAANNVCAHIDDLWSVAEAVCDLLADDGVFVFEVSYRLDVIEKLLFDTIYHEHLDYHAVAPLNRFLQSCGLNAIRVDAIATHGGSIRVYACKGHARPQGGSVKEFIEREEKAGLFALETYTSYETRIAALGDALRSHLIQSKQQGRRVAGYGAPAKTTTLMYHLGLNTNDLAYIVDDSPLKQGMFTPGLHIPVVAKDRLAADPVDDLLILAWNFSDPIIANNKTFLQNGGRFIVPLPDLKVIDHATG